MNPADPTYDEKDSDMTGGSSTRSLDIRQIMDLLPHRYPFLLIDKIVEINGDESCIGIKNVTINEPFFQGHFPGRPIMPGVLLLEGMAQSAGAICSLLQEQGRLPLKVYFLTINKAKFRRPVVPGDCVEFHMKRIARRKKMWWYRGEAKVDGVLACEAEVGAMIAES
jgi:3-hydroxyacyl-[acyl-carrier-protein] dehydratase